MSAELWLGIDVGTQGVRAVLVDGDGTVQGSGRTPLAAGQRSGREHEQDPETWWAALCASTRAALSGSAGGRVAGLAVDSTSGTVLVQDPAGRPLTAGLMYDDARAVEAAARVQRAGEQVWSSLGYRVQPSWALPKVSWLVDRGVLVPGSTIAHQADWLGTRLTGGPVATDTSHALKTGYDALHRTWPYDVLDALGIPADVMPAVVLPGELLGVVSVTASAATGIPAGTPLLAGMTDGCAAQIAARALRPGSWSSALGTTLVVKGSTGDLLHDPSGAVYSHLNPDGGWLPGGASSTGAGSVSEQFSGADLDTLTRAAAALGVPAGTTYPLRGRGERFPFVAPDAAGFSVGVGPAPEERFGALLHGVALVERLAYDVLRGLGADVSGPVTLSGGATRNRWWNQLRADVLGRPTLLPEGVEAALGMAVLAAAPRGQLAATAERMVHIVERYEPDPTTSDRHAEAYERLCAELVGRGWLDPAALPVGTP